MGSGNEHVEKARQHVYDLAAGRARFSMSIPPRAAVDSDFVLIAACEVAEARAEELAAARAEIARLRAVLACERGEAGPDGWRWDADERFWFRMRSPSNPWAQVYQRGGVWVWRSEMGDGEAKLALEAIEAVAAADEERA